MARYVTPEVRDWMAESASGDELELALAIDDGEHETVTERAGEYSVSVHRQLPSGVILVTASADTIEEFIDTPAITSVSRSDRMTIQT